ncbi:hypothetical protein SCHPADRAFT_931806 [Schizopora paradoxa]|uniref:Uncharacterized protein n=1 Tax=Schizopora paradoxa TaxID=27342 RepID=A0A0H2RFY0_9AGAM|nr:hypothetical protein SCHPADRAFT_931806 [Schizopora paradoxa]
MIFPHSFRSSSPCLRSEECAHFLLRRVTNNPPSFTDQRSKCGELVGRKPGREKRCGEQGSRILEVWASGVDVIGRNTRCLVYSMSKDEDEDEDVSAGGMRGVRTRLVFAFSFGIRILGKARDELGVREAFAYTRMSRANVLIDAACSSSGVVFERARVMVGCHVYQVPSDGFEMAKSELAIVLVFDWVRDAVHSAGASDSSFAPADSDSDRKFVLSDLRTFFKRNLKKERRQVMEGLGIAFRITIGVPQIDERTKRNEMKLSDECVRSFFAPCKSIELPSTRASHIEKNQRTARCVEMTLLLREKLSREKILLEISGHWHVAFVDHYKRSIMLFTTNDCASRVRPELDVLRDVGSDESEGKRLHVKALS